MTGAPNKLGRIITLAVLAGLIGLAGCATRPQDPMLVGRHHCESIFLYSVCVADRDEDGAVDYMYFGDDLQVFMYDETAGDELRGVQPFHECAIPMSKSNKNLSSQLLYGDDLGLSKRLALKGRLIRNYRATQPAVDACNARGDDSPEALPSAADDPFLIDEDWDDEPLDEWDDELPQRSGPADSAG